MGFRRMRCRHGLRREDVFLLLMALAEAAEDAADGPPPPDLSMLIEPRPSRLSPGRAARSPVGERSGKTVRADA